MGQPSFCAVWVDSFNDEVGFRVVLEYPNSGEVFVYEVGPNVTQLIVPALHIPRPTESDEQCRARKDFRLSVSALLPGSESEIGNTGGQSECR
jgi:hypothetical protein